MFLFPGFSVTENRRPETGSSMISNYTKKGQMAVRCECNEALKCVKVMFMSYFLLFALITIKVSARYFQI